VYRQRLGVVKEFTYLGAKLEISREFRRQKEIIKAKGIQTLRAIRKCVMRAIILKLKY
jgi:hypothetical protein